MKLYHLVRIPTCRGGARIFSWVEGEGCQQLIPHPLPTLYNLWGTKGRRGEGGFANFYQVCGVWGGGVSGVAYGGRQPTEPSIVAVFLYINIGSH